MWLMRTESIRRLEAAESMKRETVLMLHRSCRRPPRPQWPKVQAVVPIRKDSWKHLRICRRYPHQGGQGPALSETPISRASPLQSLWHCGWQFQLPWHLHLIPYLLGT